MSDTYPRSPYGEPFRGDRPGEYPQYEATPQAAYPGAVEYPPPSPYSATPDPSGYFPGYQETSGYYPAAQVPSDMQGLGVGPVTVAAQSAGRKGLWVAISLVSVSLIGVLAVAVSMTIGGGRGAGLSPAQAHHPQLVEPSEAWANGYEIAWELDDAEYFYAQGDRMVVFGRPAAFGDIPLSGYDISGSEPRQIWKEENANVHTHGHYWVGDTLFLSRRELHGKSSHLVKLNVNTGEMEDLMINGTLFDNPYPYRFHFEPDHFLICDDKEVHFDEYLSSTFKVSRMGRGCSGFDFEGNELWSLKKRDFPDGDITALNSKTGELIEMDTADLPRLSREDVGSQIVVMNPDIDRDIWFAGEDERQAVVATWTKDGELIKSWNSKEFRNLNALGAHTIIWQSSGDHCLSRMDRYANGDDSLLDEIALLQGEAPGSARFFLRNTKKSVDWVHGEEHVLTSANSQVAAVYAPYKSGYGENLPRLAPLLFLGGPGVKMPGNPESIMRQLPQPDLMIEAGTYEDVAIRGDSKITAFRPKR